MKLKQIADVSTGLVLARKKADFTSDAMCKYKVITLRSISNSELSKDQFDDFFSKEEVSSRYLTERGDILLRISEPYSALMIKPENKGMVVPSSFYIIRLHDNTIIPEYLCWYLNSKYAKKQILSQKDISTMNIIQSVFVRNLQIEVPDLLTQKSISELCALKAQEMHLLDQLKQQKKQLYTGLIKQIIDNTYKKREV